MTKAGHDPLTRVTMYQYELQEWTNACRCYDSRDYDKALRIFMVSHQRAKAYARTKRGKVRILTKYILCCVYYLDDRRQCKDAFQHWRHI